MKIIRYTVDLSFINAPSIHAQVAVTDPITGEERTEAISIHDDDAREIVSMKPNPNGTGLVVDDGSIDHALLKTKVQERLDEAGSADAAKTLAERLATAEAARKAAREAEIAAANAAKAQADAEQAKAEAEAAKAAAESAAAAISLATTNARAQKDQEEALIAQRLAERAALDAEVLAVRDAAEAAKREREIALAEKAAILASIEKATAEKAKLDAELAAKAAEALAAEAQPAVAEKP